VSGDALASTAWNAVFQQEGLSDGDAEILGKDFVLGEDTSIAGEDGELGAISMDNEETKDHDDGDGEWAGMGGSGRDLLESRTSLGESGYLPDELFAQTAAALMAARVQSPTRRVRGRKRWRGRRGIGRE